MGAYDNMIAKLPAVMRQTNVKSFYTAIGSMMDEFDTFLITYDKVHLVDSATGDWLDNLGKLVSVERNFLNDADYRAKIKLEFYRYYYVPTLDNLLALIKKFSGVYPDLVSTQNDVDIISTVLEAKELAVYALSKYKVRGTSLSLGNNTEPASIKMSYDFSPSFDIDIFDDLDKFVGGGVRLINEIQFIYYSKKFIAGTVTSGRSFIKRRITQKYIGG